ncbi:hypothetical protein ACP6JD_000852 [Aspergillus fumigatus]
MRIPKALLQSRSEQQRAEPSNNDDDDDDDDDSESQSSVADDFNDDILMLRRYSLISIDVHQKSFNMHGLGQLATRRWLEVHGELEKWKRQYIRNLNAEFPTGDVKYFSRMQTSAASQRPHERDSLLEWAAVCKAAWYDMQKGNGAEGERLSVKVMEALTKHLGPEHEDTLESGHMVGLIYTLEDRRKEAEELQMQVMKMRKKLLCVEHPDTLVSMGNLAWTYRNQGIKGDGMRQKSWEFK